MPKQNIFGHTWWKLTAKGLHQGRRWKTAWRELWSAEAAVLLAMRDKPNKIWSDGEIRRATYGGTLDREGLFQKTLRSMARKGYVKRMPDQW